MKVRLRIGYNKEKLEGCELQCYVHEIRRE